METKVCVQCNQAKEVDKFYLANGRRRLKICRDCSSLNARQYRYMKLHGIPTKRSLITEHERFLSKVDKNGPNGCWDWTGSRCSDGYGNFTLDTVDGKAKCEGAHRYSYRYYKGEIPKHGGDSHGICVMHLCNRPCCVNPDHLVLGTHQDNIADMIAQGRGVWHKGEKNHMSTTTWELVDKIRATEGMTLKEMSGLFGMSIANISKIRNHDVWKEEDRPNRN